MFPSAAGIPLAEAGGEGGALLGTAGGPLAEITVPAGAALGSITLGGYGAIKGGKAGFVLGQAACSSGTGNGGGGSGKKTGGRTDHDEGQAGEPNRQVGDPNKVIRDGKKFTDSDTGYDVHVDGDRVVITDPNDGNKIVTRFINSRANTLDRVQNGRWIPK